MRTCRCTWNGKDCNVSETFETILTELGVCFQFNGKNASSVEKSGSQHGLELILNVEQYEHMRGPQNDAGVKAGKFYLICLFLFFCQ